MKNKKSKIIIPAMGLILLSTAASISGSVAWFTANRTTTVKAGEFAVVKSGDNLKIQLAAGVGNSVVNTAGSYAVNTLTYKINPEDANEPAKNYKLTDASFDHTWHDATSNIVDAVETNPYVGWTNPYVVEPNDPRDHIAQTIALGSNSIATDLVRESTSHVYSAFTWDITFTIEFSESSNYDQGLFLDLSSNDTWMHEKLVFAVGDTIPAGNYWTTADCSGNATNYAQTTAESETILYKKTPDSTGQAFRIAFVPTAIGGTGTGTSEAYAKVWAQNEVYGHDYGTQEAPAVYNASSFVAGNNGDVLSTTAYSTNSTLKLSGYAGNGNSTKTSATAAGGVLMSNNPNTAVPDNGDVNASQALGTKNNYLGLFKLDKGKTVSLTFTCVAWYDGTHPEMVNEAEEFENIVTSMRFTVANLANA